MRDLWKFLKLVARAEWALLTERDRYALYCKMSAIQDELDDLICREMSDGR